MVQDKATGESVKVAVKVLNPESSQGMDEWLVSGLANRQCTTDRIKCPTIMPLAGVY